MTPRSSTLLALIGVLLAGIPLPALTGARCEATAAPLTRAEAPAPPRGTRQIYATLHWSGQPVELRLLHEGRELVHLSAEALAEAPAECELELPATPLLDLELEARWPEGGQAQAVSLTLEPENLPQQQHTQWTEPGSHTLHSLFSFAW